MARNKGQIASILKDPRYLEFAATYQNNLAGFLEIVCDLRLSHQQYDLAHAMQPIGAKVSVASGHGTGKSHLTAGIALHFLICHPNSLVMLTANNIDQVLNVVFSYIKRVWGSICKTTPWLDQHFMVIGRSFYAKGAKGVWQIFGKTAAKGNEEGLAGNHRDDYLVVVDEASGVHDKAFDVMDGALTQENNKMLMISQFTRPAGRFADSQGRLAKSQDNKDGIYTKLVFNSEESPFVTDEFIRNAKSKYGGIDSPEYQIRVLGVCPDNIEGFLISRSLVRKGFENEIKHEGEYGYLGLIDVGTGGQRDSSILNIVKVSGWGDAKMVESLDVYESKTKDAVEFISEVYHRIEQYPNITLGIDAGGYGLNAVQAAEKLNLNVRKILWGNPTHSKRLQERFRNERAYASFMVMESLEKGRLKLFDGGVEHNNKVASQFTKIPYKFDERSRWQMKSKEDMRKEGIKSPDIFDSYAFIYLTDYIPAGEEHVADEADDYLLAAQSALKN